MYGKAFIGIPTAENLTCLYVHGAVPKENLQWQLAAIHPAGPLPMAGIGQCTLTIPTC